MKDISKIIKIFLFYFAISFVAFGLVRFFAADYIADITDQNGLLRVYFLDIGQGDAAYIRAPNGNDMLIDAGPSRLVLSKLAEVMPWYDRHIDVVLETHPDADHIGGMPDVLSRYHVDMFIQPGIESANGIDDEITRLIELRGIKNVFARRGMRINFGENGGENDVAINSYFEILFPDKDPSKMATNDASIVGRMIYGSTSVMFTGDSPKSVENLLIRLDAVGRGENLKSDILKAGHHGSRTSSGENYLKTVAPKYAIISAGIDNRYGHPHKEVMDLFKKLGIEILETSKEGTIGFESDGKVFRKK